jgi:HlyD family secretion protein
MGDGPLRRLFGLPAWVAGSEAGVADAALLERFARDKDEAAFELLLRRHGPMVLAACRRLLGDEHDAEDAFQAAFLALARKAGSVTRREAVAAWLYRVAFRAALRLRTAREKRRRREQPGDVPEPAAVAPNPDAELRGVLDEEVAKLPARHRAAFVLCCLEGLTGPEAARELGCRVGTVSSRLSRARERLRARLARRGLAPAIAAALATLPAASAALPLIQPTLAAAMAFAARLTGAAPARPAALAEGVLRAMTHTKLKIAAVLLAVAAACAGLLTQGLEAGPPVKKSPAAEPPAAEPPRATAVTVVRPQKGGVESVSPQVCSLQAFAQADLYAGVAGTLKEVAVDIGAKVKKGDVLATIETPELEVNLRLARVGIERATGLVRAAEAQLQAAKAEVEAAKGAVDLRAAEATAAKTALTFREKQFARFKSLFESKAIDAAMVDEAEANLLAARAKSDAAVVAVTNAKAELLVKQARLTQAEAELKNTQSGVEVAKLELDKAKLVLERSRIVAPYDGVVTGRNHFAGDFVSAGETARQPVLILQRMDLLRAVVLVPDRDVHLIEAGLPAVVTIDALPGKEFAAKVARFALAEDPRTATMRTEIDLPNAELLLRPGMTGRARLRLKPADPKALRLPWGAVLQLGEAHGKVSTSVYVVRDGKARLTPVRLGTTDRNEVEILSGVGEDDQVVAEPKALRGETIPVEIKP